MSIGHFLLLMTDMFFIIQNREREIAGLIEAMNEFKLVEGTIITDDIEAIEEYGNMNVRFVPLWKWLLG